MGNSEEIEEERRVLYVALTRAKNELIITRTTDSLNAYKATTDSPFTSDEEESAYFLENLPEGLVNQESPLGQFKKPIDATSKNEIDLDFGFDFS